MKLELVVFVDREGAPHVFAKAASLATEFSITWELWEGGPELAREISVAVAAAIDALQAEAEEAMQAFFRSAPERLAESAADAVVSCGAYKGHTIAEIAATGEAGEAWLRWCIRRLDHPDRDNVVMYARHFAPAVLCAGLNDVAERERGGGSMR